MCVAATAVTSCSEAERVQTRGLSEVLGTRPWARVRGRTEVHRPPKPLCERHAGGAPRRNGLGESPPCAPREPHAAARVNTPPPHAPVWLHLSNKPGGKF